MFLKLLLCAASYSYPSVCNLSTFCLQFFESKDRKKFVLSNPCNLSQVCLEAIIASACMHLTNIATYRLTRMKYVGGERAGMENWRGHITSLT